MKYSRKINQFTNLSRRINVMITNGDWDRVPQGMQRRLLGRLRHLLRIVRSLLAGPQLKKVLAGAAVLLCCSTAGAQSFMPPVVNPYGITTDTSFTSPAFADIDSDGDYDLFLIDYNFEAYELNMNFFENTGTAVNPVFAAPVTNPFSLSLTDKPYRSEFADLDDDGDLDFFVGEYYGTMQFYENTGSSTVPVFAAGMQNPFGLDSVAQQAMIALADLDNDGDLDLLVGEYYGALDYFQNTGTAAAPNFSSFILNPFGLSVVADYATPEFADLDNDGDFDLLIGAYTNDLYYFENTGTISAPAFTGPVMNPFGLSNSIDVPMPAFVDINGDGDLDLFIGGYDGTLAFFENTAIGGVDKPVADKDAPEVFPVPADDYLTIRNNGSLGKMNLRLTDATGRTIKELAASEDEVTLQVGDVAPGLYILEILRQGRIDKRNVLIR